MLKCHVPNIRSKSLLIIVPLHTLKIQDLDHASDYSRVCIPFVFVFIVYIEWIKKNIHIHAPFLGSADIHDLFKVLFAIKNSSWIMLDLVASLSSFAPGNFGFLAPALTPRSLKERQRVAAWPRSTKMRAKLRRTALLQILRLLIRFHNI